MAAVDGRPWTGREACPGAPGWRCVRETLPPSGVTDSLELSDSPESSRAAGGATVEWYRANAGTVRR